MAAISIKSTGNVPLTIPVPVRDVLRKYVPAEIDDRQIFMKSLDPPSWIGMVGNLETWQLLVIGAAGLYLKEILKEAAKEHWRDRSKILAALKAKAVKPVLELADAIARMRLACTPRTNVVLVLAWPDDFWGTRMHLGGLNEQDLAVELAVFLANVERIQATLTALENEGVKPMAPIQVHFLEDRTLELHFIDTATETDRHFRLPPIVD